MTSYNPPLHLVPFPVGSLSFHQMCIWWGKKGVLFAVPGAFTYLCPLVGWKKSPSLRDRIKKIVVENEFMHRRTGVETSSLLTSNDNLLRKHLFVFLISTTSGWREHCELRPTCSEKHLPGTSAKRSWDILKIIPPLYQRNFRKQREITVIA